MQQSVFNIFNFTSEKWRRFNMALLLANIHYFYYYWHANEFTFSTLSPPLIQGCGKSCGKIVFKPSRLLSGVALLFEILYTDSMGVEQVLGSLEGPCPSEVETSDGLGPERNWQVYQGKNTLHWPLIQLQQSDMWLCVPHTWSYCYYSTQLMGAGRVKKGNGWNDKWQRNIICVLLPVLCLA